MINIQSSIPIIGIYKITSPSGKISKPIMQYDLDMNFIKEWPNLISVTRELKIKPFPALKGIYKQSGGFKWKYK